MTRELRKYVKTTDHLEEEYETAPTTMDAELGIILSRMKKKEKKCKMIGYY